MAGIRITVSTDVTVARAKILNSSCQSPATFQQANTQNNRTTKQPNQTNNYSFYHKNYNVSAYKREMTEVAMAVETEEYGTREKKRERESTDCGKRMTLGPNANPADPSDATRAIPLKTGP